LEIKLKMHDGGEERVSTCAANSQNWSLLEFQGSLEVEERVAESSLLGQASLSPRDNMDITIGKYVVKGTRKKIKSFLVVLTKEDNGKFCTVGAIGQHTSFEERPQPPLNESVTISNRK
jgi:hypothetical protein